MRENGVSEFPDPNASGDFAYGIKRGSSLDPSTAAWKKAISACKDLQPPGIRFDGKRSPEQQSAGLKFAQCMRENGVKDFPDPVNGEPLVDTGRIPSAARNGVAGINAAMQKCRVLLAEAAGGRQ